MPQTLREIRDILSSAGLRPQKRLGQNFLIDGNLMTKIVDAAEVGPSDVVLEVGAGTGSLTEMLLERAGWVVAVEVDRGMSGLLADRLSDRANLTLLHADVLESKSRISPYILQALRDAMGKVNGGGAARNVMLVANLPYQVASPLLVDLLLCDVPFTRYCFCVQREVADRLTAEPGCKEYGPMSIVLQLCGRFRKVANIPAQAFWPPPKVASTALRLEIDLSRFPSKAMLRDFAELVRLAFSHRRKMLNYNLKQQYDPATLHGAYESAGIDLGDRAEAIPLDNWYELFKQLQVIGPPVRRSLQ